MPPPPIDKPIIERREPTRRIPVPDPEPERPEPIPQAAPLVDVSPSTVDVALVIPDLRPPPSAGPLIPDVGDVRPPVLIEKGRPDYPELARRARLEGEATLQAIIRADGTVGEVRVLRCTRPGAGFEEEAMDAVRRWRYEPATQRGTPVDVYFTVQVVFALE